MSPATWPRESPLDERLLRIDPRAATFRDARVGDLARMLGPGDLLVVNDGATLPASLRGRGPSGAPLEARLIGESPRDAARAGETAADGDPAATAGDAPARRGAGPAAGRAGTLAGEARPGRFTALLFGAGDWRTRTEDRPAPPPLGAGDELAFGADLAAVVEAVSPASPRVVELRFRQHGAAFWTGLYRHGRPIQYAHVAGPLELWHTQTRYGSRPWCAELPSAGRPLAWSLLLGLVRRGVALASLTHAAGLSSTGDRALDARLPLPERFDLPAETVRAVESTRRAGGRVLAVGTTVARALEGCAALHDGRLVAGEGLTDLRLGPGFRPRIVDGLLTGMHEPTESHFELESAFAPVELLHRAHAHAEGAGYLCHEFGDSTLILAEA